MKTTSISKPAFSVIGREGSTKDGDGFVGKLWAEANQKFSEISHLAKRDSDGNFSGFWGLMTDFSRSFQPWENNFSEGLYLAGAECEDDAIEPEGWTKWTVPGFEYIIVPCESENPFLSGLTYLSQNGLSLAGAVQDFTCPKTGKSYMLFPVGRMTV
ncbi:MAG: effector binding domain-containing protein [Clostridia bacterium]|nr:effector binding domain-containing protein [Clostridia bacterium]MBQ4157494.1 effector binding domain-containing protein [Clostridia bacterium]